MLPTVKSGVSRRFFACPRRCRYLFQYRNPAPYIVGMNTKTDIKTDLPLSFIGNNKDATFYGLKPKKPSLSAEKLGRQLTKTAVVIAAKNQTIKGTPDYKKVDRALIHLCEAIKELKD